MKAILLLQDGTVFEGKSFGAKVSRCGEVVFNTAMSGYQEIITDPSYHQQIVTMTYPQIGNYGTNSLDVESKKPWCAGFVVKQNCDFPSNWRSSSSLSEYLQADGIPAIEGIDTRKLVRHIRTLGAMNAILSCDGTALSKLKKQLADWPGLMNRDIVQEVTAKKRYKWQEPVINPLAAENRPPEKKFNVVAMDFGIKQNILRLLVSHGCEVTVVPAKTSAQDILALKPDGVFLSNGPGDPDPVSYAIDTIKQLLGKTPIFGICLGHQLLGLALGAKRYKLKFGHHGANHPVKNLKTKKIEITSQNHCYCIDADSLNEKDVKYTHWNLNDDTCEGFCSKKYPAFAVQYHPEASPGPHDSTYLFDDFVNLMNKTNP